MEKVVQQELKEQNNKTVRFSGSPWYEPGIIAIIGGSGGIGSWLSFLLARQEMELYVFDFDTIDETNMGGQLFNTKQIGMAKTDAIIQTIALFSENFKVSSCGKYEETSFSNDIVFSAFDNMKARSIMFENWVKHYEENKEDKTKRFIFIDGRLLAEQGEVYFVTPDRIQQYRATIFEDSEVALEDCSYKATSHCSAIIGGLMVSGFNNFITNRKVNDDLRDVPFSIKYELPLFSFNFK